MPCPASLTGGGNMLLYYKPGSHPWDMRVQVCPPLSTVSPQPVAHTLPVRSLQVSDGGAWRDMDK